MDEKVNILMTNGSPVVRQKSNNATWIVLFLVALVSLLVIAEFMNDSKPSATDQVVQEAAPQPILEISAKELEQAYDENEVAAQMRFDGHLLRISGVLESITLDGDDQADLHIDTGAFLGLNVDVDPSQKDWAAQMAKGDKVIVECTSVREGLGKPFVEGCLIVEDRPT